MKEEKQNCGWCQDTFSKKHLKMTKLWNDDPVCPSCLATLEKYQHSGCHGCMYCAAPNCMLDGTIEEYGSCDMFIHHSEMVGFKDD